MKDSSKLLLTLGAVAAAFFGVYLYNQKQAAAALMPALPAGPPANPATPGAPVNFFSADPHVFNQPGGLNAYGQSPAEVADAENTLKIQKLLLAWLKAEGAQYDGKSTPSLTAQIVNENGAYGDGSRKAVEWFQVWADDNIMTGPNYIHGSGPGQNPVYGNLDPLTIKVLQQWAKSKGLVS